MPHADGGAPQLAYVDRTAPGVSVIDIAQRRVTGSIAVAGNPRTVLSSPDRQLLYISQPAPGRVEVLTAKTGKTLRVANLPGQPSLLTLSLDANTLYAAGQGNTTIVAREPARVLRLSGSPQSVAITSDGQLGFVALSNGQVLMLDIPGRSIVTGMTVGDTPHFIITGLYPPASSAPSSPQQPAPSSHPAQSLMLLLLMIAAALVLGSSWLFWKRYQKRPA